MSKEREALLRAVRGADEPSDVDEQRVLRALQSAIAAGRSTPVSEQVEASLEAGALRNVLVLSGGKLAGIALAVLSITAGIALLWQRSAPSVRPATMPTSEQAELADHPVVTPPAHDAQPARGASERTEPAADAGPANRREDAPIPRHKRAAFKGKGHAPELPRGASGESQIEAELSLMRRVQAALRDRDGARALAELEAYPHGGGMLEAERAAARVLTLCLLDRREEARAAAADFAVAHPSSPQRATLDASCANPRRNEPP